jgi:hypothetical protein
MLKKEGIAKRKAIQMRARGDEAENSYNSANFNFYFILFSFVPFLVY